MNITSRLYTYLTLMLRHGATFLAGAQFTQGFLTGSSQQVFWGGGIAILAVLWGLDAHRTLHAALDLALEAPRGTTREQLADQMWH